MLDWGSYVGNALGAGFVTALMLTLPADVMETWGWRLPFLIALPMGGIALYLRTRIEDTPAFRDAQAESDDEEPADLAAAETDIMLPEEGPLGVWDMLRTYWRELLIAIVLVTGANTVGYALTSYMPTYLTTTLGYDAEHGPLLTLPILVLVAFLVPTMGWVSDHLGRKPVLFSAALSTVVLAVPSFLLMEHGELWSTLLGLTLFAYPTAAYVGNLASSLPALFPTASRYGGMGISYNVAVALFGGTAAFIALFKLRETARRPLPGSMPSVASQEEVVELVETQEDNPDLDVEEIFAVAPAHLVDTEPTVAEAQAEVEVALANEAEARERLERAERATAAAQQAVAAAQEREDVSGNVTYLSQGSAAA